MSLTREEVLAVLEEKREAIHRLGVRRLGLFGSIARGDPTPTSDLDFLVEFDHKSFDSYMDLKELLEEVFACRVDLVLADTLKPRLRESVLKETVHAPGL
jgi:hypothetical protein